MCFLTGQKNGKGVYKYDEKRRAKPDPEILKSVLKAQEIANLMPGGKVLLKFFGLVHIWFNVVDLIILQSSLCCLYARSWQLVRGMKKESRAQAAR